jgi:glycosyltransferase involved in cell wall biosynthesis
VNILFIAFEMPPLAGAGVYRPIGFIRHLPEFGITPIVITTDISSYLHLNETIDSSLMSRFPSGLLIERVPCRSRLKRRTKFAEWRKIFLSIVEESASLWRPNVVSVVDRLAALHKPAAVYVTAPPFSMAPLAVEMSKRLNLPLIVDFRDAWSQWRVGPFGSWFHYRLTLAFEEQVLQEAAKIVTTSEPTRADFLRVHPRISPDKISVIMNGYDKVVTDWSMPSLSADKKPFIIGYVGNFYYSPKAREGMMRPWWRKRPNRMIQFTPRVEDWLYRSPYFFFRAVAELFRVFPETRDQLKIRFAGRGKPDWLDSQIAEFGLEAVVEHHGQLEHEDVLKFQEECDALLVTSSKVVGGLDYGIAGKTFEYFTMRKPIIGFVTEGAQKDLLRASGMALICDPDETAQSAGQLRDLLGGRIGFSPKVDLLQQLSRRELTGKLAHVIRDAVGTYPSERINKARCR